jgi:hypothetical protein
MNESAVLTPEAAAYQAKEMQQFLAHEATQRAFAATEQQIIAEWMAGTDPLQREMCWHQLMAFRIWKTKLRAIKDGRPLALVKEE